jgi:hypothetical protein
MLGTCTSAGTRAAALGYTEYCELGKLIHTTSTFTYVRMHTLQVPGLATATVDIGLAAAPTPAPTTSGKHTLQSRCTLYVDKIKAVQYFVVVYVKAPYNSEETPRVYISSVA